MSHTSVVLGFSGGLDTSYCVKYLTDELGYEIPADLMLKNWIK